MTPLGSILAQDPTIERMQEVRRAFRHEQAQPAEMRSLYLYLLGVFVLLVALVVAGHLWQRRAGRAVEATPRKLFAGALKQLGLGWLDRLMLRLVARRCGLDHPIVLLFNENTLERHVRAWAEGRFSRLFRRRAHKRLPLILQTAFAPPA